MQLLGAFSLSTYFINRPIIGLADIFTDNSHYSTLVIKSAKK